MSSVTLPEQSIAEPVPVGPPHEPRTSRRGEPTWEVARCYPLQGQWTESEFLALDAAAGRFVELSNGMLEFPPMPSLRHQLIFEVFYDALRAFLRRTGTPGRVVAPPFPVRLWPGKWREPDVVYLRPERITSLDQQPTGADLVIEIVSPGDGARQRDLTIKPAEYAAAGIPEYWIVDPETRTITVLTLDGVPAGGPYRVHGEFRTGQTAASVLLPGFTAKVDEVLAAGENDAADHDQGSDHDQKETL